ncbi:MAG: hypothetical protein R2751_19435 [Bacteroidales bacterium]
MPSAELPTCEDGEDLVLCHPDRYIDSRYNYEIAFVSADFTIQDVTGIDPGHFTDVQVFPNPTRDMLNIELGNRYKGSTLKWSR